MIQSRVFILNFLPSLRKHNSLDFILLNGLHEIVVFNRF